MSRGFVREGDQEEPVFIPPRVALPPGEINYVTPVGMQLLLEERENLENEKSSVSFKDENQHRREMTLINGKLNDLQERINSARIIDPKEQPKEEVRFGAIVTYLIDSSKQSQRFQIVGVDEADVRQQKISFVSPMARALTGRKEGETFDFLLGGKKRKIQILQIKY